MSCYDATSLGKAVVQHFEFRGLEVSRDPELRRTQGSLRKGFVRILHISPELLSVALRWRAKDSTCEAELRVLCGGPGCEGLRRRFRGLLGGGLAGALRAALCAKRCGRGRDISCRSRCLAELRGLHARASDEAQEVAEALNGRS